MALSLPFAEAHLIAEDRSHVTLSILGDDVSVRDHVRDCFFDILGAEHRLPIEMTKPFLISRERLEALEHWPEWKMLQGFVFQYGLEPTVVFRNTPVRKGSADDLYVADLRMLYISTIPVRI